jgi:Na+-driven multidrug efflux pump
MQCLPRLSNDIFYSPCRPGIIITVCATIVTATIATIFRNYIPLLYTTWPPAVAAAADVIPVVAAFLIFDGTQVRAYWLLGSNRILVERLVLFLYRIIINDACA